MTVAMGGVGTGAREVLNKVLGILEQGLRDIARARDTVIDTSKRNIADVSWIKVKSHIQFRLRVVLPFSKIVKHKSKMSMSKRPYIHLINQARGSYWENMGSRSWHYGPRCVRSVQKRPRADILPVRSRASEVNKGFISRLKKIFTDRR